MARRKAMLAEKRQENEALKEQGKLSKKEEKDVKDIEEETQSLKEVENEFQDYLFIVSLQRGSMLLVTDQLLR